MTESPNPRPASPGTLVRVALAQATAGMIAFAMAHGWSLWTGQRPPLIGTLAAMGILAAVFGYALALPRWWAWPNLVLPPTFALALLVPVHPLVWLGAAAALGLVFRNALGERVPLYLSNRTTWRALADLVADRPGLRFLDAGAGIGGVIAFLAGERPDGDFLGLETAPVPFALARARLALSGLANARVRLENFRDADWREFDVVYCFLSPAPMAEVYAKARTEMRPGTLLISNSFEVPGETPDDTYEVADRRRTRLLVWRM